MKNTTFYLSNEPYNTLRRQKMMSIEVFKVHIPKNKGFLKNFNKSKKKNTHVLSKTEHLESLAQPILVGFVSYTLQNFFCAQILL